MPKQKDLVGQRFGQLVVRAPDPTRLTRLYWICLCDCGQETSVQSGHLVGGLINSCGCGRITHGLRKSPEYVVWNNLRQRCTNPNNPMYDNYGGRGIGVDPRWEAFEVFHADMGPRPSDNHSIEREDVNGNYEPNNCVWATKETQANNTRRNVFHDYDGRSLTTSQLAREGGMSHQLLKNRLDKGMTLEEALALPVRKCVRGSKR